MDRRIAEAFGHVLRDAREGAGLSQEKLAFESGIDRTFVSMLERGVRQPSLTTIFQLAEALEALPEEMVERTSVLIAKNRN